MSQRMELVRKQESGLYTATELALEFGVSRPTVYEWVARYAEEGEEGLNDRSSRPLSCPHQTADEVIDKLIEAKQKRPHWGPKKLLAYLGKEEPGTLWPSVSTGGRILEKEGLVKKRRPRGPKPSYQKEGHLKASESGEMMTADHKGEFRMGNAQYVYPVTIKDPVSRYLYAVDGKASTSYEFAKPSFERVFRQYGIPDSMGTDNGGPFCCVRALGGLSRLSVWWIKLGIKPVRIHKGCPWENGRHERTHRTLKAETARPPGADLRAQQKKFQAFREEYNHVRPHEGIGNQTPASLLRPCRRSLPSRVPKPEYPAHFETRLVRPVGTIGWGGEPLFVSSTLAGERIGLEETGDGIWTIYFASFELGRYSERTKRIA